MSDAKISALPSAATLTGAERLPVSQSNQTRGATAAQLLSSSLFTQTGTGAIARSINSKFGDIVSVKDFGAVGDGVTDDTAAIQAAVTSLTRGGIVKFPIGTYKMLSTVTIAVNGVYLRAAGLGGRGVKIQFEPTSAKSCFKFDQGGTTLSYVGISGFEFASSDTTFQKTCIEFNDVDVGFVKDIICGSGGIPWTGANSRGILINGRQQITIEKVYLQSDSPIVIGSDPNSPTTGCDHLILRDCTLVAPINGTLPCILGTSGSYISNFSTEGYQAWIGGAGGFKWADTSANATVTQGFSFKNIRWEQSTVATAYCIELTSNNFRIDLVTVENVACGNGANYKGYKFKLCFRLTLANVKYDGTAEGLNINICEHTIFDNCFINNLSTPGTFTGVTRVFAAPIDSNTNWPTYAIYELTSAIAGGILLGSSLSTPSPRTGTNATDTITALDSSFIANRAGTITLTLQAAASFPGRELVVRTIQAQTVISDASNVVPLVGGAAGTAILAATAGKWALLKSDGAAWQIMAGN